MLFLDGYKSNSNYLGDLIVEELNVREQVWERMIIRVKNIGLFIYGNNINIIEILYL